MPEGDGSNAADDPILTCGEVGVATVTRLLHRYGLEVCVAGDGEKIPGSYWGEPEAGLLGTAVWIRRDTPVHSLLHEACHVVCADPIRRATLDTEAGGDDAEENGVCYLQILLADHLDGVGRDRLMADMDAWGYSFRLGSTRAWFEDDAEDARRWLVEHGLLDGHDQPTWQVRCTHQDRRDQDCGGSSDFG